MMLQLKRSLMGRRRLQSFFERLPRACLRGMNYGNGAYTEHSGEKWVISNLSRFLCEKPKIVVFDVGSNAGQYMDSFIGTYRGDFEAHCFEPSKVAFEYLTRRFERYPNITLNRLGLSKTSLETKLFSAVEGSTTASLHLKQAKNLEVKDASFEKVKLTTLDEYCAEKNVEEIDFLKIDVEGHEHAVLCGASKLMADKRINLVQFEVSEATIRASIHLKDFFVLLEDFDIFRVLQNGIWRIDYSEEFEIFLTTNYLAVRRDLNSCGMGTNN